jgi:hypothetical protein
VAILAAPIVEEATLRIHRRRGMEARAAGIAGVSEPFYRIFGPDDLKPVVGAAAALPHSDDDHQPPFLAAQPSPQAAPPSGEVVGISSSISFLIRFSVSD